MLSTSPRHDLFKIALPKELFPQEILNKYNSLLGENNAVLYDAVDYINESIVGVNFPGISGMTSEQQQVYKQSSVPTTPSTTSSLGQLKIISNEPVSSYIHKSPNNLVSLIDKTCTIEFRQNTGLYNYFMMYETIMYHMKRKDRSTENIVDFLSLDILSDIGQVLTTIYMYKPVFDDISGIDFSYNKIERQTDTFTISFKYSNIDIDFDRINYLDNK